jgi:hypothetical protein
MPGRILGVAQSQSCGETIGVLYIATTVTQALFIATIPCFLTAVALRIRVGSTSGTATLYKAPSGTAAASGTALTASIDLSTTPTADTTINVPLIQGPGLALNPGDSIAVVIGGTMTSGVGLLQLFIEPQT